MSERESSAELGGFLAFCLRRDRQRPARPRARLLGRSPPNPNPNPNPSPNPSPNSSPNPNPNPNPVSPSPNPSPSPSPNPNPNPNPVSQVDDLEEAEAGCEVEAGGEQRYGGAAEHRAAAAFVSARLASLADEARRFLPHEPSP